MKFNEKLVMLRKQQNLSQEQVSEKLGVARQTISKWELGETTPEMDKLIIISKLYDITLDELMKEDNEGKNVNDPNNMNSQKLAGLTIKFLKGIGIPPPQPNKHKSTIVTPLSFTSIFINLLYYFIFIHMILILPYII